MKPSILTIHSISEQHRLLNLEKPMHPLFSILRFEEMNRTVPVMEAARVTFMNKFYSIVLKKNCTCKTKYGQQEYDYDQGMMSFFAPNQVITLNSDDEFPSAGWSIHIHPDFLKNYPLHTQLKNFGFFYYSVNEALHLSHHEEKMIEGILENLHWEYYTNIDSFSQDIVISQLDVLLNYSNRFYNRQFITRKHVNTDLLIKLETFLQGYFDSDLGKTNGLPTVKQVAGALNVSPNYLGDLLRKTTGKNTQEHIHAKVIDLARELLVTSTLSIGEIAYRLGFDYSQSFSKLFKNKTDVTPLSYRSSFNVASH